MCTKLVCFGNQNDSIPERNVLWHWIPHNEGTWVWIHRLGVEDIFRRLDYTLLVCLQQSVQFPVPTPSTSYEWGLHSQWDVSDHIGLLPSWESWSINQCDTNRAGESCGFVVVVVVNNLTTRFARHDMSTQAVQWWVLFMPIITTMTRRGTVDKFGSTVLPVVHVWYYRRLQYDSSALLRTSCCLKESKLDWLEIFEEEKIGRMNVTHTIIEWSTSTPARSTSNILRYYGSSIS